MKGLTVKDVKKYSNDEQEVPIDYFINNKIDNPWEIIHLHCCRPGPLLSNDIFISIKEKERYPRLKRIIGIVPPFGTFTKYLLYWFGGLDSEIIKYMINHLEVDGYKLKKEILKKDSKILFQLADNVFIDFEQAIEILLYPLYENYKSKLFMFKELKILEKLSKLKYKKLPFSFCLKEISSQIINAYLREADLPEIIFREVNSYIVNDYIKKTVNIHFWKQHFQKINHKRKKREQNAINEILKRFKGYTRKPKYKDLIKQLKVLSKKKSRAYRKTMFNKSLLYLYLIGDKDIYKTIDN